MISNRISKKSSYKNHFDKAAPDKNNALKKIADLMKMLHIFQVIPSVKLKRDKLFGSIFLIVPMSKLMLVKFL